MRRSMRLSTAALATVAAAGLALPSAGAGPIDAGLYPQSGHIYIDPVSTKILAESPVGDLAGTGADLVYSTAGPMRTVAVLSAVEGTVNGKVREAAQYPNGSIDITWNMYNGGVQVSTHVNGR